MKRTLILPILLIYSCLISISCTNSFLEMEHHYKAGNYLSASQKAIEGLKQPNIQQEVGSFLDKYGTELITRLQAKGQALAKRYYNEEAILYLQAMTTVLEELVIVNAPIAQLENKLNDTETLLKNTVKNYVHYHYESGKIQYLHYQYRKAITHLERTLKYHPNYKEAQTYLIQAKKRALRNIHIFPFNQPQDSSPPLIFQGQNISRALQNHLINEVQKHSTPYLKFHATPKTNPKKPYLKGEYYIKGTIKGHVKDTNIPHFQETKSNICYYTIRENGQVVAREAYFQYDIYAKEYTIFLQCQADIYLTKTQKKIASLSSIQTLTEVSKYREQARNLPPFAIQVDFPTDYLHMETLPKPIDKALVLTRILNKTADKLSQQLTQHLDLDLDPYVMEQIKATQ